MKCQKALNLSSTNALCIFGPLPQALKTKIKEFGTTYYQKMCGKLSAMMMVMMMMMMVGWVGGTQVLKVK